MSERILEVVQAGRVPYGEALEWQRRLAQARIAGRQPHDLLLLLEHPPVVTLGRNSHHAHLLRTDGIEVFEVERDRKSTRLNSSHGYISYAVFCLKKKKKQNPTRRSIYVINNTDTIQVIE